MLIQRLDSSFTLESKVPVENILPWTKSELEAAKIDIILSMKTEIERSKQEILGGENYCFLLS